MLEQDKEYKRKIINIGNQEFIVLEYEGERWWSLPAVFRRFIGKSADYIINNEYQKYVKKFFVKYTARQPEKETRYIKEIALICMLVKTDFSNYTANQIEKQNALHRYLGLPEVLHNIEKNLKLNKSKVKTKWDTEKVIDEIFNLFEDEQDLNVDEVSKNHRRLYATALKYFGSWKNAVCEAGLDYDELFGKEDPRLIKQGLKFESLLGDILSEMQIKYVKGYNKIIKPDFRVGKSYNYWIDAKLSEWTESIGDTINKYEPHCTKLTIIFLRGDRNYDKYLSDKTRIVSVYKFIEDMQKNKRSIYVRLLDRLYKESDRIGKN